MTAALRRIWPLCALAGVAGSIAGLFIDPHALLASYLAAAVAWSAIPIGALAVLLTTYLVRGEWTEGLHAPLTAAALTLPVVHDGATESARETVQYAQVCEVHGACPSTFWMPIERSPLR